MDVAIELPEDWDVRQDVAPLALMAGPRDRAAWAFVPSVTVQVLDADPERTSLATYVESVRLDLDAVLPGHRLLQLSPSEREATIDLLVAVSSPQAETTIRQRHRVLSDGQVLVATATCADVDWPDLAGPLTIAVSSVRPS